MKNYLNAFYLLATSVFIQSCCGPTAMSGGYGGMPFATTETHTKTIQPASFSMPYVPPASVYQAPPMAVNQQIQAPMCQPMQYSSPAPVYQAPPCQPQAYASPVCPPTQYQNYRSDPCQPMQIQAYQADPCNPNSSNAIRYNIVGTANAAQPQYIVVHPSPSSQNLQLQGPQPMSSDNDCH